jgi:hypothetical protein
MNVVGSASGVGTSIALPAHQPGDLIVLSARRASNTAIGVPAAGGTVPVWTTAQGGAGANTLALTTVAATATASNHTSGSFNGAAHICVLVLRPDSGKALSLGASAVGNANNVQNIVYPALTLQDADGLSWGIRTGTRAVAVTAVGNAPTNWTNQQIQPAGAGALMSMHLRQALVANPVADTVATAGTNSAMRAHTVEILETVPPAPLEETLLDDFNRADGLVYSGAGSSLWTVERLDWNQATLMRVIGNRLGNPGATYEQAVSIPTLGPGNFDLVLECAVTGGAPNEIAIWFCVSNHGPAASVDGYAFIGSSSGTYWAVRKYVDGANTGTIVGPVALPPIVAGDTVWFAKRGTTFTIYRKPSGGNYAQILSFTDATYSGGVIAVEASDATIRWDNVRGGPWTGLGPPKTAQVVSIV